MDVKTVLRAILDRCAQERMLSPMRTRLVKLLYLTELEYFRRTGRRLTSADWRFHHFGPYASTLVPYLGNPNIEGIDALLAQLISKDQPSTAQRDHDLEAAAADVVHEWGDADLNALLDYVYFDTEPMQAAKRGEMLDFTTVSRERTPALSIRLDDKRVRELRKRLSQRAALYGDLRQPSTAPDDLFQNLHEWDADRSVDLQQGPCAIDPEKLS